VGKFSERDVKDTLDKVVSGHLQTQPLDQISIEDRDCAEFYDTLAANESEDDEILRETLEALRRRQEDAGDTQSSKLGRRKKRSKDEL
jgi:hypothetical protein